MTTLIISIYNYQILLVKSIFLLVSYSKCRGNPPHPVLTPPTKRGGGGGEYKPIENCAKKRRIGNLHGHLRTRIVIEVTSATSSLEIEGVKDRDGQTGPTDQSIKIEGGKWVK